MDSQALAIESLLEGSAAKKPGGLLLGLGAKLHRASDLLARGQGRSSPSVPCFGLDQLLEGGLPRGRLVELAGRRSSGRFSIGLAALASVTSAGEPVALVDLDGHLDPRAASETGVNLELLLWVRPRRVKEALASAEMLLAAGFPLVVADFGLSPRGARYLPDASWLRLARAASAQDSSLLLLTPWRMSGIASDAVLTSESSRPLWQGAGKTPRLLAGLSSRLTLQKLARTTPGNSAELVLSVFVDSRQSIVESQISLQITNRKSQITNSSLIHPAPLQIRAPRPEIRNNSPIFPRLSTVDCRLSTQPITNHKSQITTSP